MLNLKNIARSLGLSVDSRGDGLVVSTVEEGRIAHVQGEEQAIDYHCHNFIFKF